MKLISILFFTFLLGIQFLFSQDKVIEAFSSHHKTHKVIIFYSTTCPICQKMTSTLNKIYEAYKDSTIQFQIIFPSKYESAKQIHQFQKKYHLKMDVIQDKEHQFVNQVHATVTPECFLMDSTNAILYSGKIDNWFYDIGKYRQVITENYLKDAIDDVLNRLAIKVNRSEPIGCIIEP